MQEFQQRKRNIKSEPASALWMRNAQQHAGDSIEMSKNENFWRREVGEFFSTECRARSRPTKNLDASRYTDRTCARIVQLALRLSWRGLLANNQSRKISAGVDVAKNEYLNAFQHSRLVC